jgi:threonine dehydrogenase-like Zn-dependent dehydrogenase
MRAVVFHNTRNISVETVADPHLEHPRDAVVRVTSASICGSDLHVYNGVYPHVRSHVPGHELVGVVEEVGAQVRNLKRGDRVVVPFAVACGTCWFCERGFTQHCTEHRGGGGMLGFKDQRGGYSGGQAQFVRVPFADFGPRHVPQTLTDEQVLLLSDMLPTAYAGLRWAQLQQGESVAIWGCGPVGLMAMKLARAMGAALVIGVDVLPYRLDLARRVAGAVAVDALNSDAVETVKQLTGGRGADVGIEAVGLQADLRLKDKISSRLHLQAHRSPVSQVMAAVRPAGRVSLLGVHGPNDTLPLPVLHQKGLRVSSGHAPVHGFLDELMEMVRSARLRADDVITHRLPMERAPHAYEICSRRVDGCVKVALNPWAG